MSVVVASKEQLLDELSQALVEQQQCQEMVWVDEERVRLSRDRLASAGYSVMKAQEAINEACKTPRVSESMGELYKRHGLR